MQWPQTQKIRVPLKLKINCKLQDFSSNNPFKLSAILSKDSESLNVTFIFSKGLENLLFDEIDDSKIIRQNELWKETCFELFLKNTNATEYIEINIATSGAWNIYVFDSERIGMREYEVSQAPIVLNNLKQRSELSFKFSLKDLPSFLRDNKFEYQISAVLKTNNDQFFYAIKHLKTRPDFHDLRAFSTLNNDTEVDLHSEQ